MMTLLFTVWTGLAHAAAPALTRESLAPYLCRFRDGDDVRDVIRHGRPVSQTNLADLKLDGSVRVASLVGVNLPLYGILKQFSQLSGYDIGLSPAVARLSVTFRHAEPLGLDQMADLLWREFARLNLLVIDDGYLLRVLARCR